jgi:hypothetical protein
MSLKNAIGILDTMLANIQKLCNKIKQKLSHGSAYLTSQIAQKWIFKKK